MKLSEVKDALQNLSELRFELPTGVAIPSHFHITEVGLIRKDFIDCGGVVRQEKVVNFQLWEAQDFDHQLAPSKFLKIIQLAESTLGIGNWEVEVEYQADTIGKYGLTINGNTFILTTKSTNCLASDKCGIPDEKLPAQSSCKPGSGCC